MEKQWKANPSSDNDLLFQFSNTFPSFSTYFEMSFKVSLRSTELHASAISINSARSRTYQDPGRKDRSMKWIEVMYSDVSFAASTIKYYSKISGLHRQILMLQRAPSSHHGTGVWQWSQCCPDSWYSQCKNQRTKPVQNLEVGPGWKKKTSIEQLGTGQECETQNWIVQYRKLPVDLYSRLTSWPNAYPRFLSSGNPKATLMSEIQEAGINSRKLAPGCHQFTIFFNQLPQTNIHQRSIRSKAHRPAHHLSLSQPLGRLCHLSEVHCILPGDWNLKLLSGLGGWGWSSRHPILGDGKWWKIMKEWHRPAAVSIGLFPRILGTRCTACCAIRFPRWSDPVHNTALPRHHCSRNTTRWKALESPGMSWSGHMWWLQHSHLDIQGCCDSLVPRANRTWSSCANHPAWAPHLGGHNPEFSIQKLQGSAWALAHQPWWLRTRSPLCCESPVSSATKSRVLDWTKPSPSRRSRASYPRHQCLNYNIYSVPCETQTLLISSISLKFIIEHVFLDS